MIYWKDILIRLLLACLFGALIGLERERKNWAAGIRTHMMVCVGSCLIMIVSAFGFSDILGTDHVDLDPSRIAAQVVSGIGFIGAGAILFQKQGGGTIRGLTTAAGLWTVAAIGLATGGGLYFAASATTVIAIIILWALQPIEYALLKKYKQTTLRIVTTINNNEALLNKLFNETELKIHNFTFNRIDDTFVFQLTLDNNASDVRLDGIMDELRKDVSIKEITLM